MKIVMTSAQFVKKLKHIATDLNTFYKNVFPYNLGYYHEDGRWSWDCWNLVKSLIWGWEENETVGYYAKQDPTTGLGDWDGETILAHCTDVSVNFNKLTAGEYLVNAGITHAGVYVGDHTIKGKTYNVIEATPAFGGGVVWSYCDNKGNRFAYKDSQIRNNAWTQHGKLPWIKYKEVKEDTELKSTITAWQILAQEDGFAVYPDGVWGKASIKAASTPQSKASYTKHLTTMIQGVVDAVPDGVYGRNTELAVKEFQKKNSLTADGVVALNTWKVMLGIK